MKANIISILTVLLCTSFISCKKSQVASEATLTVYVHHHEDRHLRPDPQSNFIEQMTAYLIRF